MATNWQIGRVGSKDLTGKWEDKSVAVHDYWENNETDWTSDLVWTFTGKGITRDSD
jgi:hypothetical protein|tara:strand:- start:1729 stop:1896 length:168 start_codon:yes stop_codon:yes gene_type:complete